ncbi:very long chain fatty acid elongase 4-like isoform X1 [Chamaea fasciata]|uniref:very long chain fatty acid elongase 4-like isoform X1 n=1 Tax=Chamaea fasciata TaxID=190680 RepID=UPI00336A8F8A
MASTWQKTQEFYNWVLESGDPRTDPWPLVYSPVPVTLVFTSYLLMVALGPSCMRQRQRLELRAPLLAYNLAMVALSSYMFYEFLVTSVLANYSYLCQPVDYSRSELGMRTLGGQGYSVVENVLILGKALNAVPCAAQQMARVCWWFFFSKVIELLDTVFLILRKKQEQVTFLHVYHHGSMLFNWWSGVKYVPGGQAFFIGMLNSFVHIFMYGYYALASLGPRMHRYLWWKRYLTILQMCQFVAIAAHSSYNLFTECPFPDGFNTAVFLYILSLLALFLRFYYRTYIRGKREKLT